MDQVEATIQKYLDQGRTLIGAKAAAAIELYPEFVARDLRMVDDEGNTVENGIEMTLIGEA
ncbi:MAG: hypothetical protein ABJA67_15735 [Chthonomonadales bacterium]